MQPDELRQRNFYGEMIYSASRSSGPGGQNVNKVSTKVELRFNLASTALFTDYEKALIVKKLKNKINKDMELVLIAQKERTQLKNKISVTDKFFELIAKALTVPGKRKSTRPTLSSKVKRLDSKRMRSNVKKLRNPGHVTDEF